MTPSRLRGRAVVIVEVRTRLTRPNICQGEHPTQPQGGASTPSHLIPTPAPTGVITRLLNLTPYDGLVMAPSEADETRAAYLAKTPLV
jgi:hypothetical protein